MKLDEDCSKLCVFNSPFRRYKYLRLPFGISSAPDVYHKKLLFEHIDGVDTPMDDIIVWGSTKAEHDERLCEVLETTRKANLKLNRGKCELGVKKLVFIGDVLTERGVQPDKRTVSAIVNMPRASSKVELQRFLGMVNYLGKFVYNLSTKTEKLRILLDKTVEWQWGPEQEWAWQDLKTLLSTQPLQTFYDPLKTVKISPDASQCGLGAVILQQHDGEWQPVAYASIAMTSAETRHAQIEKELLSIMFACERFHHTYMDKQ